MKIVLLPLPQGEGWGEGIDVNALILTFSQWEKGSKDGIIISI